MRVEVTIDETGAVTNVQVLKGLGYGLDEAAIEAIRQSFQPGHPLRAARHRPITFNLRFALGS